MIFPIPLQSPMKYWGGPPKNILSTACCGCSTTQGTVDSSSEFIHSALIREPCRIFEGYLLSSQGPSSLLSYPFSSPQATSSSGPITVSTPLKRRAFPSHVIFIVEVPSTPQSSSGVVAASPFFP